MRGICAAGTPARYYFWGILKLIDCILGGFFGITKILLDFPGHLLC